jgi:hypothetical protein
MKCRQWVVDVILKQTPSRLQQFEAEILISSVRAR